MDYISPVSQKICLVCGDHATAYNFGGLTCDSCKIFFRRNAPKIKKLKCHLNENCSINILTRKHCPKCRIRKCIAIGMELRWLDKPKMANIEAEINLIKINSSSITKNKETNLRTILLDDQNYDKQLIDKQQSQISNNNSVELSLNEWERIDDIQNAMQIFVDESTLPVIGYAQNLSHGYSYFGFYARRIIKFCKHFSDFKSLNQYDQLTILKPFYMEFFALRYTFQHNKDCKAITLIENETGNQAILFAHNLYPQIEGTKCGFYVDALKREMEDDQLIAISLFSPRENMINFEIIRYQFHSYDYLLKRYLQHKYMNDIKAAQKYDLLMHLISNFYLSIKERLAKVFAQYVDYNQVGQVMTELFCPKFFG